MKLWSPLVMFFALIRISRSFHFHSSHAFRTLKSNIPAMTEIRGPHGQKPKVIFVLGGSIQILVWLLIDLCIV